MILNQYVHRMCCLTRQSAKELNSHHAAERAYVAAVRRWKHSLLKAVSFAATGSMLLTDSSIQWLMLMYIALLFSVPIAKHNQA